MTNRERLAALRRKLGFTIKQLPNGLWAVMLENIPWDIRWSKEQAATQAEQLNSTDKRPIRQPSLAEQLLMAEGGLRKGHDYDTD